MGDVFQCQTLGMCFHLMFTPHLGRSPFVASTDLQSPLAFFFPELEAEGRRFSLPDTVQVELPCRADYCAEFAGSWLVIITDFLCDLIPLVAAATV